MFLEKLHAMTPLGGTPEYHTGKLALHLHPARLNQQHILAVDLVVLHLSHLVISRPEDHAHEAPRVVMQGAVLVAPMKLVEHHGKPPR